MSIRVFSVVSASLAAAGRCAAGPRRAPLFALLVLVPACGVGQVPPGTLPPSGAVDAGGGGGGGGGGGSADASAPGFGFTTQGQMIRAYGDCMSYQDWLAARLIDLPAQPAVDEAGKEYTCQSCHGTGDGQGGAFLDGEQPDLTFRRHRVPNGIYKLALVSLNPDGSPGDVVENDRYVVKGQEGTSHPMYILSPELARGLDTFYTRTHDRFVAHRGHCTLDDPLNDTGVR